MKIPTIHMNGTGGKTLMAEYTAAMDAVKDAGEKLYAATLNGRDYYPQGPGAFDEAREERMKMQDKLLSVYNGLQAICIGISDQLIK